MGEQIGSGERFRVPLVNVQGVNERSALQDDAYARMPVAVNPPFVSLGVAKPAFQVEIVLGQASHISAREESGLKAGQHLGHLPTHGIIAGLQLLAEDGEPLLA